MLQIQGIYPFHYQRVQNLLPGDFQLRVQFCQWILENDNIIPNILWSDESIFTKNGVFNVHNNHVWAHENPRVVRRSNSQHRFSVNTWAGMIGDQLIGPVVLPNRLNAHEYLNFLQNNLGILLEDVPLNARQNMYYQNDGAPAHYGLHVREWLSENFPRRWIGRNGPIPWPPRSPDLNPLDYYLWGRMKALVYETEVNTQEELLRRIELAAAELRENRFQILRATSAISRRARICIEKNVNLFQQFL